MIADQTTRLPLLDGRVMRVALLTPLPTPYRQPLLERLVAARDWDVTVFYFSATEPDRSWHVPIPENDGRFRVLPVRSLAFMGKRSFINHWNPGLTRELDRGAFDAIIVPGYALWSSQAAILWAWRRRKPYIIQSESHLVEPRTIVRRLLKEAMVRSVVSRAAACLATGTMSREYLQYYGARKDRVFFLPNTPDVDWFVRASDELAARRLELRRKWGIPAEPTVLFVGRLIEVKGVHVLLAAFAELQRGIPDAQLVIVGDGPEDDSLRRRAAELGVADRVHFLGFHQGDDLVELYVCADAFCLPSLHEPWGVVVNEAAACRLPLVVSDRVGAGRDLIRPGENGAVVPAGDHLALARALAATLKNLAPDGPAGVLSRQLAQEWGYERAIEGFHQALAAVRADLAGRRAV